ncbi:MAG: hypothetical protein E7568_01825 [Ruminococcaceae bacterium]|nr:hypothetical protein [Oscillospiraceae bacterium]
MKKKLLTIVLSVVMLASLLAPMLAISADEVPTITIGFGTIEVSNGRLLIPIVASDNTGLFYAASFDVKSENGINAIGGKDGTYKDEFIDEFGDPADVILETEARAHGDYVRFILLVNEGLQGISTPSGLLGTAYFTAPTEVGTYTFTLVDANPQYVKFHEEDGQKKGESSAYNVTVSPATITYTVECTSHNEVKDTEKSTPAKCGVAGEDVFKCSVCGKELRREPLTALQHKYNETPDRVEGAECGKPGKEYYDCLNGCGNTKDVPTDALSHILVEKPGTKVPAKCGVPGSVTMMCSRGCGHEEPKELPALEHDWELDEAASTAPKCGVAGEDVYVCQNENCPQGTKKVPVDALEHDWEYDEEASTAPKCGVAGEDVYVCQNENCPDGTKKVPVDALEHDYDYDYYDVMEVTLKPTAAAEGSAKVPCFNGCGEHKVVPLDKLAAEIKQDGASITATEAILPEDVNIEIIDGKEEDGKVEVEFTFGSYIVDDLEGAIVYTLDISGVKDLYTNFKAYRVNADNSKTLVSEIKGDSLVISADLKDTIVLMYEEIPEESGKSPATGDSMNVVVLALVALTAVAGLVVITKKRFAL